MLRVIACLLAAACAAPALAADVPVSGRIGGGSFTVAGVPGLMAVPPLRAWRYGMRRAVVRVPVTVTDARGTGGGWSLSLSAATRTASGGRAPRLRVSVWSIGVRCAACTEPRARVLLPIALPEQTPVRAFTARHRTGMGRMRLVARLVVTAPVAAAAGPYVLRPTVSRIAGP